MKRILVISDLQIPFHHEQAVKNVVKLARREKFDEVLITGDEIDFNTISKWADKTPMAYEQTLHRDRLMTQDILWDLTENARVAHCVRSNHTDRLYHTLLKVPGLLELPELQYENFVDFKSLGIQFHKTVFEFHPGWVLAHGDEGSMNQNGGGTAAGLARKFGVSVVCGHTHRLGLQGVSNGFKGSFKTVWGLEAGNLMDAKKAGYLKAGSANWQMGIAILEIHEKTVTPTLIPINKDGSFVALGRKYG